jgi:hypothetical protein
MRNWEIGPWLITYRREQPAPSTPEQDQRLRALMKKMDDGTVYKNPTLKATWRLRLTFGPFMLWKRLRHPPIELAYRSKE